MLMALRVLLADESSTIKRVMQLALQDFAVEVKSVPVGLDVLPVAKTFKPDIVFADVLLTKRNGYEVCMDLKNDPETVNLPVVLMWSGFMEIDEAKIALATAKLEKPFDAETLRQLVLDLVPKTQNNPVSPYLQFPKMPEFTESPIKNEDSPRAPLAIDATVIRLTIQPTQVAAAPAKPAGIPKSAPIDFDRFDPSAAAEEEIFGIPEAGSNPSYELPIVEADEEEFTAVPLKSSQQRDQHEEDGWSQQDLKKFKIQIPEERIEDDFASKFVIPQSELQTAHVQDDGEFEELHFGEDLTSTHVAPLPDSYKEELHRLQTNATETIQARTEPRTTDTRTVPKPTATESTSMDSDMIERVIREEARAVIESICWKVIPEMAERIVREEISKILRDVEK
ncbi:MAG: response regulator [Bdellovibrionaceae bacterium]|nr:response regulator [Pseudobdellovibrionaceae bacterium]